MEKRRIDRAIVRNEKLVGHVQEFKYQQAFQVD